jgi:hypothetical protein
LVFDDDVGIEIFSFEIIMESGTVVGKRSGRGN